MADDVVYVPSCAVSVPVTAVYHTDRDCPRLAKVPDDRVLTKPRSALVESKDHCLWCSGEAPSSEDSNAKRLRDVLLEADPEDLGLSPVDDNRGERA